MAMVAEVSLSSDRVRVHHLWAAVDCGTVVNPLGVEAQIAGGLQFGTSAALYEAITFKSGRPEQSNFGNYRLLRMTESPTTEVRIVPSTRSPTGVGEIAVPTVAPAVANALFQLTGKRHRVLPLRI